MAARSDFAELIAALTPEQRDLREEAVTRAICQELDRLIAEGRARLLRAAEERKGLAYDVAVEKQAAKTSGVQATHPSAAIRSL
jgi:hypothetical protein